MALVPCGMQHPLSRSKAIRGEAHMRKPPPTRPSDAAGVRGLSLTVFDVSCARRLKVRRGTPGVVAPPK